MLSLFDRGFVQASSKNEGLVLASDTIENAKEILSLSTRRDGRELRASLLTTTRASLDRIFTLAVANCIAPHRVLQTGILNEAIALCSLENWNPTHILDTAEIALTVSTAFDLTRNFTTEEEKRKLREALSEKALKPALRSLRHGSEWSVSSGNWAIICNAAFCYANSILENSNYELERLSRRSLERALDGFSRNGDWKEGPTYSARILNNLSIAEAGLTERNAPLSQNFLSARNTLEEALLAPSGELANFGDTLRYPESLPFRGFRNQRRAGQRMFESPMDLVWDNRQTPAPNVFFGPFHYAQRTENCFLAVKLGKVDPVHGHIDSGSFIFERDGHRIVCDPGRLDYSAPGYFDLNKRFNLAAAGPNFHTCFEIDGSVPTKDVEAKLVEQSDAGPSISLTTGTGKTVKRVFLIGESSSLTVVDKLEKPSNYSLSLCVPNHTELVGNELILKYANPPSITRIASEPVKKITLQPIPDTEILVDAPSLKLATFHFGVASYGKIEVNTIDSL